MSTEIEFTKKEIGAIENGFLCESWQISPELKYFEGHFPHFPVLPAVAIIDACLKFIKTATDQNFVLLEVTAAKFLQPLPPGEKVRIQAVSVTPANWDFDWYLGSDPVAQVRFVVGLQ
jgi:3-hydroxymyristoyl/3-hydroxydecanoyl-(acyl carrier protein) dehydratase